MEQTRFNAIEKMINEARATMQDCDTARAIDQNAAWGEIALIARRDGFKNLADQLAKAELEWCECEDTNA